MEANNRIINTFEISLDKPRMEILKAIEEGKKKRKWSDFLFAPNIDYREFIISEGQIAIIRRPTLLSGYRPYGTINIDIQENEEGKSHLTGKILIPKNGLLIQIIFVTVLLTLWTSISLIISTNSPIIVMTIVCWFVFGLIIFLYYKFNNWKLIDYSKKIIMELKKNNGASR